MTKTSQRSLAVAFAGLCLALFVATAAQAQPTIRLMTTVLDVADTGGETLFQTPQGPFELDAEIGVDARGMATANLRAIAGSGRQITFDYFIDQRQKGDFRVLTRQSTEALAFGRY